MPQQDWLLETWRTNVDTLLEQISSFYKAIAQSGKQKVKWLLFVWTCPSPEGPEKGIIMKLH